MGMTRDEFSKLDRGWFGRQVDHEGHAATAKQVVGAAVAAEKLMGTEEWQRYQSYMQDAINTIDAHLDGCKEAIFLPHIVDAREIAMIKHQAIDLAGQRKALEWALELPKDIQERGNDARKLLNTKEGDAP